VSTFESGAPFILKLLGLCSTKELPRIGPAVICRRTKQVTPIADLMFISTQQCGSQTIFMISLRKVRETLFGGGVNFARLLKRGFPSRKFFHRLHVTSIPNLLEGFQDDENPGSI
jgi:hypothetical protein